jgi:hypothetical protein
MRARDHVHGDQFTDPPRRGSAGIGGRADCRYVAAHHRGHVARSDLLPAHQIHFGGLHHSVGGLNHGHQTACLDHS